MLSLISRFAPPDVRQDCLVGMPPFEFAPLDVRPRCLEYLALKPMPWNCGRRELEW